MSRRHRVIFLCAAATCCLFSLHVNAGTQRDSTPKTRIVLLGTGTPSPDPARSGPATAIVANGTPYLIDFGPGVVRRIAAASQKGVQGLSVLNIKHVFLTHLHSDHTAGYPDLILTPWSAGLTHSRCMVREGWRT
jgi:ribonuclease BN (tRNA processing enzyme)